MSQPTKTATTRRSPSANGTEGSRGSKRTARGLADVRFQEILNALLAAEFQTQPMLPQSALKRDSISMKRRGGGGNLLRLHFRSGEVNKRRRRGEGCVAYIETENDFSI